MRGAAVCLAGSEDSSHVVTGGRAVVLRAERPSRTGAGRFRCTGWRTGLLDHLTLRATQRGEYLADVLAARAGSTEAAVGLMDRLLVAESAESVLLREVNSAQVKRPKSGTREDAWHGLWERLADDMDSIPESEYERRRRCGALRGHSVDSTHPPTHLRRARLQVGSSAAGERQSGHRCWVHRGTA